MTQNPREPVCKTLKIIKNWSDKIVRRTAIIFGRTRTRTAVPKKPKIAVLYGRTVQYGRALVSTKQEKKFPCVLFTNDSNKYFLMFQVEYYARMTLTALVTLHVEKMKSV